MAFTSDCFGVVTSGEQLALVKERIPHGAIVALDTEGSPHPFCALMAFLDQDRTLVYGWVPIKLLGLPSVNDMKFQAGVGWRFRLATDGEVGIEYVFIGTDGVSKSVPFDEGMAAEKEKRTLISIARVATAEQVRSLLRGESVNFSTGKFTFSATMDGELHAAELPPDAVAKTDGINHLAGDPFPGYQNLTMERVLTRELVPVKITLDQVKDGCFYALELADLDGKKTDYVVVYPGCRLHMLLDRPLVRIVPALGKGHTIDLDPTDLQLSDFQEFLRDLVAEKEVTFAAHNKGKEENDLRIKVTHDSVDIGEQVARFMKAAKLKPTGSTPVFHVLHALLKGSPPLPICGEGGPDLTTCSDHHNLPVEVSVLVILYPLLKETSPEDIRKALRASVEVDGDVAAAVDAALKDLNLTV